MPWNDRLKMGSFNDLPFLVTDTEEEGGRRIVEHDFPGSDLTLMEDLGRQPRRWRFSAIVHGPDFDVEAERLAIELRSGGVGLLVHPQLGPKPARVISFRRADSNRLGGMATFEIVAQEDDFEQSPAGIGEDHQDIAAAAKAVEGGAGSSVESSLVSIGVPEFVRDATSGAISGGAKVMKTLRLVRAAQAQVLELQTKTSNLIARAASLAVAPASLAASVVQAVQAIGNSGMQALDSLYAYRQLFGLDSGATGELSLLDAMADRNRILVTDLFRSAAVAGAARSAADAAFASEDDAGAAITAIAEEIDDLQSRANDDQWQALSDLRVELAASVPDRDLRIPRVGEITLAASAPALWIAHRYLGEADQADTIVEMNHVRDPLLVPGGVPLRIAIRD